MVYVQSIREVGDWTNRQHLEDFIEERVGGQEVYPENEVVVLVFTRRLSYDIAFVVVDVDLPHIDYQAYYEDEID